MSLRLEYESVISARCDKKAIWNANTGSPSSFLSAGLFTSIYCPLYSVVFGMKLRFTGADRLEVRIEIYRDMSELLILLFHFQIEF